MATDSFKVDSAFRPSDDINPKTKREDKQWHSNWAKFIWNYGQKNDDSPATNRSHYATLRSYGAGKQDTNKYKMKFPTGSETDTGPSPASEYDTGESKKGERKGVLNINWDIVSVFPKFRRILLGKFSTLDHAITAFALDRQSGDERENEKWELFAKKKNNGFMKEVYKMRGLDYQQPSYLPDDVQELELFESMGGFKLKHEQAMELMIQHTFDVSDWDKNIKDLIFGDLIDLNIAAVMEDFDTEAGKVKQTWADVARLIYPGSFYNNGKKAPFWGYEEYYTIVQLRQKGFSEKQLASFANDNSNSLGNSTYQSSWYNENSVAGSRCPYNDFNIRVLRCEMRSTDTFYDTKHTNKYGKVKYYPDEYGKKRDTESKKTRVTHVNNVYQVKWIVGSEECFEYGIKNGQPRVDKEVEMSCHVIKLSGQSMVENCMTHLDELQMDFLQLQNAKANARSSGIAINFDSISNIKMGGKVMHALSILEIYRTTGDLIFKATPMGLSGMGNNLGKPMQELTGGIGPLLMELMQDVEFRLKMIREATGVNVVADASDPDPNLSVGGSEMALSATNNAIRPLYKAYVTLKEKVARSACLRTQLLLKYNPQAYEAYYPVLGRANLQVLAIGQKAQEASYTTKVEAIPTEQEKMDLKNYIAEAMRTGKNGVASLRPSHGLLLNEMLSSSIPLKKIRVMLSFLENKDRQIQDMKEKENYQVQAQLKQESDANAAKLAQQTKQFETSQDLMLHKGKAIIDVGVKMAAEEEKEKKLETLLHYFKMTEDENKYRAEAKYREEERVPVAS